MADDPIVMMLRMMQATLASVTDEDWEDGARRMYEQDADLHRTITDQITRMAAIFNRVMQEDSVPDA